MTINEDCKFYLDGKEVTPREFLINDLYSTKIHFVICSQDGKEGLEWGRFPTIKVNKVD